MLYKLTNGTSEAQITSYVARVALCPHRLRLILYALCVVSHRRIGYRAHTWSQSLSTGSWTRTNQKKNKNKERPNDTHSRSSQHIRHSSQYRHNTTHLANHHPTTLPTSKHNPHNKTALASLRYPPFARTHASLLASQSLTRVMRKHCITSKRKFRTPVLTSRAFLSQRARTVH